MPSRSKVSDSVCRASKPQRHAFAVLGRQRGHADVDGLLGPAEAMLEGAVLRGPFLGNVHRGQHLESADDAVVHDGRPATKRIQYAVHAETNVHAGRLRIDVNVRRLPQDGRVHQFIAQTDHVLRLKVWIERKSTERKRC